jgi:hypothetical protein
MSAHSPAIQKKASRGMPTRKVTISPWPRDSTPRLKRLAIVQRRKNTQLIDRGFRRPKLDSTIGESVITFHHRDPDSKSKSDSTYFIKFHPHTNEFGYFWKGSCYYHAIIPDGYSLQTVIELRDTMHQCFIDKRQGSISVDVGGFIEDAKGLSDPIPSPSPSMTSSLQNVESNPVTSTSAQVEQHASSSPTDIKSSSQIGHSTSHSGSGQEDRGEGYHDHLYSSSSSSPEHMPTDEHDDGADHKGVHHESDHDDVATSESANPVHGSNEDVDGLIKIYDEIHHAAASFSIAGG